MGFIENWRNALTRMLDGPYTPQHRSSLLPITDKPISDRDKIYEEMNIVSGTYNNRKNYASTDKEKLEAAKNGSAFARPDYFYPGELTYDKYNDFLNNRNLFKSMVVEWADEEDPTKRAQIISRYSDRYGFDSNPIFKDYIRDLRNYDAGELKTALGKGDFRGPVSPFSQTTRGHWVKYLDEASDKAVTKFNPFRDA